MRAHDGLRWRVLFPDIWLLPSWAYHHQAKIDFSRPGKPTDNRFIETFNGSPRDECLDVHWLPP
jgi:transposase InsO family protein